MSVLINANLPCESENVEFFMFKNLAVAQIFIREKSLPSTTWATIRLCIVALKAHGNEKHSIQSYKKILGDNEITTLTLRASTKHC